MTKSCNNCKHDFIDVPNEPCKECYNHSEFEPIPQTNADRIRNMTDEELAIWIMKHDTITEREGRKYGLEILDWLKAEVEG